MNHLGALLSALVDGELGGAERDRAYAHLARCEPCRAEAAGLRDLKRQLRSLAEPPLAGPDLTEAALARLLAVGAVAGDGRRRAGRPRLLTAPRLLPGSRRRAPRSPAMRTSPAVRPGQAAGRGPRGSRGPRPSRRRRYLMLSAVSVVVTLGTAAFAVGGGSDAAPGPRVTPQLELYSVEHAITTGEVPFAGPSGTSDPAGTAKP